MGKRGVAEGEQRCLHKKITGANQCFENLRGHSLDLKDINCENWLHRAQGAKSFSRSGGRISSSNFLKIIGRD